ncbi:hypothetical protein PHSY_002496 [Pseudozyma hubeiensis SY62]|uniref:Uncharacterized protein n=1 Tax=Pseudozyma hubeiensis (strain SY62) TaxID=1305764 RepID=R9P0Z6_PSEHS|nr:hypothetical protein PHSY_002496 [Pseudozyma hubeiensis SY62]GAC94923.1 hypothetical protein PHSY_002496 [Pseudozyma hubeiensis SY62]
MWSPLASASLVFLILYFILFIVLSALFILRKVPWKSRWLVLLLHVLVRLASQACGLSFGVIGYRNINVLVAYYVLGAEGYFTLVVCTARYLIAWQRNHWNGYSWMEPVDQSRGKDRRSAFLQRLKGMFRWKTSGDRHPSNRWIILTDWLLVAANAIIIAGGSLSSGAYTDKTLSPSQVRSKLEASKAMRGAGQAVFLTINVALLVCIVVTMRQHVQGRYEDADNHATRTSTKEERHQSARRPWYGHLTLLLLATAWPFLVVRGVFGVLQAVLPDLNYFNSEVYDANGLTQQFVIEETCMVTMMEFISAAILTSTYWASRSDPDWRQQATMVSA